MDTLIIFAERLNGLMTETGTDVKKLSENTDLHMSDIYHWLSPNNKYMPNICDLITLANYFKCSLDFITGLKKEYEYYQPNNQLPVFAEHFPKVVHDLGSNFYRLAKKAEFSSTATFYLWKSGKHLPHIESLIKVAKALDCSLDYLVGREN